MAYNVTQWLDRNDPNFNVLESPEIDADNLSKIEQGIYLNDGALDNLSSAWGSFNVVSPQPITLSSTDLIWEVTNASTNSSIFSFNDTNNEILFSKGGVYNFKTLTTISSSINITVLLTIELVDAALGTIWHTDSVNLNISSGFSKIIGSNKRLEFTSSDVAKRIKVVYRANATGMTITNASYTLNTLTAGLSVNLEHSSLIGTSDENCHPIDAITNLDGTLFGGALNGETI